MIVHGWKRKSKMHGQGDIWLHGRGVGLETYCRWPLCGCKSESCASVDHASMARPGQSMLSKRWARRKRHGKVKCNCSHLSCSNAQG